MPETEPAAVPADPTGLLLIRPEPPDAGDGPPEARSVAVHLGAEELALVGPGTTVVARHPDPDGPPTLNLGRRVDILTVGSIPGTADEPDAYEVGLPALAFALRYFRERDWRADAADGPLHALWAGGEAITAPALREVLAAQSPAPPTATPAAPELPEPPFEAS